MSKHTNLFTSVGVIARRHEELGVCENVWERIEAFLDGPKRWQCMPFGSSRSSMGLKSDQLDKAMLTAAKRGYLHITKWLHEYFPTRTGRDVKVTTDVMDAAATHGHLDIVHFLHSYRTDGCSVKAIDGAAIAGHAAVVKYLRIRRTEGCSSYAFDGAIYRGDLNLLQFLHHHYSHVAGISLDGGYAALSYGDDPMIKWLEKHYRKEMMETRW